eukprot:2095961-Pleurochrysis_carterae.AAC.3
MEARGGGQCSATIIPYHPKIPKKWARTRSWNVEFPEQTHLKMGEDAQLEFGIPRTNTPKNGQGA